MTEAASLKPELGKFGVWLGTRTIAPDLAAKIDVRKPGSDRLIDAVVAYGTPEAIARRPHAHLEAGADHVAIQVLGGFHAETLLHVLAELAGPLGLNPGT